METAAYLYSWDVVGDPAAADLVAGLGLSHVTLAAVYHGTRALTPRHPGHRVVVAEHTAAYYPLSTERWDGTLLHPPPAPWTGGTDAFGAAASVLGAAGVPVHAWVVVNHVDLPGPAEFAVTNAYGDRYPWALCPAQEAVREYALGLAGDIAELPGVAGVELESFGWYGFDHLSAHDKVGGVRLTGAEQYLFSLCFCDGCDGAYRAGGVHPDELRARVLAVLDPVFAGAARAPQPDESEAIDLLLGAPLSGAVRGIRDTVVRRYRSAVVGRIRERRPELAILAHASPQAHRYLSFTGLDPARAGELFDGLVVNCWQDLSALTATRAAADPNLAVLASFLAVEGMGGRPATLAEQGLAAQAAGANGIRLYHAGLAGSSDLDGIRELTQTLAKGADR
jgi:hypothetical protein